MSGVVYDETQAVKRKQPNIGQEDEDEGDDEDGVHESHASQDHSRVNEENGNGNGNQEDSEQESDSNANSSAIVRRVGNNRVRRKRKWIQFKGVDWAIIKYKYN